MREQVSEDGTRRHSIGKKRGRKKEKKKRARKEESKGKGRERSEKEVRAEGRKGGRGTLGNYGNV